MDAKRILWISSDSSLTTRYNNALKGNGYLVDIDKNAEKSLPDLQYEEYYIICIDYETLSKGNLSKFKNAPLNGSKEQLGLWLLDETRASRINQKTPVIFFTVYPLSSPKSEAMKSREADINLVKLLSFSETDPIRFAKSLDSMFN